MIGRVRFRLLMDNRAGRSPDPRFTLANERTYLAWIRTTLALIAAGVVAFELMRAESAVAGRLVAVTMIAVGTAIGVASYRRWIETEQALRREEPVPYSPILGLLALSIAFAGCVAFVAVVVR